jgi:hypothetical protein
MSYFYSLDWRIKSYANSLILGEMLSFYHQLSGMIRSLASFAKENRYCFPLDAVRPIVCTFAAQERRYCRSRLGMDASWPGQLQLMNESRKSSLFLCFVIVIIHPFNHGDCRDRVKCTIVQLVSSLDKVTITSFET